jgi:hypothetical protein
MTAPTVTGSWSATTPSARGATTPSASRSSPACKRRSTARTSSRPPSAASSTAHWAPSPRSSACCARPPTGKLRIDRAAIAAEAKLDGKFLLRTSDESLDAEDIALGYKALYEAERGWRDMKSTIDMRPVYHRREDRIESHVQLCWLALLLLRVAETETRDTWRNLRSELDRMHLVTLATNEGTVAQRTELTHRQRQILKALDLPEPPRFYDFTPAANPAE